MKHLIFSLALLAPLCAHAANYVVVCATTCTAFDGTTQPAGTALNRIIADPTFNPGPGLALIPDTGQSIYAPPPPAPTIIAPLDFMSRLTPAEQTAIATAGQSNAQILLFLLKLSGATQVDVTDPLTVAGVNAMVSAGLLTAPRGAQILNLLQASP
jgi:hypothetical protein